MTHNSSNHNVQDEQEAAEPGGAQPDVIPPSPPPPSTHHNAHNAHKKHTRHHVKRRSAGRVHVTKLAPMARTNAHTDTELEAEQDRRPNIRRSQSQRSLNRLTSFERKGAGLTALTSLPPKQKDAGALSPPTTPTTPHQPTHTSHSPKQQPSTSPQELPSKQPEHPKQPSETVAPSITKDTSAQAVSALASTRDTRPGTPTLLVTNKAPAASAQHSLHVTGNSIPQERSGLLAAADKKMLLRSEFVDKHQKQRPASQPPLGNVASAAIAQPAGLSRTQQKLMLQRQHCLVDDETNMAHPRNMLRLTREMERVNREYQCLRRYQDPMLESLARCMRLEQEDGQRTSLDQDGALVFTHNQSTPSLPTYARPSGGSPPPSYQPHAEHRLAIHRRRMLDASNQRNGRQDSYHDAPGKSTSTGALGIIRSLLMVYSSS